MVLEKQNIYISQFRIIPRGADEKRSLFRYIEAALCNKYPQRRPRFIINDNHGAVFHALATERKTNGEKHHRN